jgi:hypothetical protein
MSILGWLAQADYADVAQQDLVWRSRIWRFLDGRHRRQALPRMA